MSPLLWKCSQCGKTHEGLPHFGFHAPGCYAAATPEEKERDFKLTSDTCTMVDGNKKHFFVRAVLLVPILETSESLGWGVWSSLSQPNFERYLTLQDASAIAAEPSYFGWLSNRINLYPDTLNLKCQVKLQPHNKRPHITLEPTDHPLAQEQNMGISLARAQEIASWILHPPSS